MTLQALKGRGRGGWRRVNRIQAAKQREVSGGLKARHRDRDGIVEYSNFDLRIDRASGGFKAWVSDSRWGEAEHLFAPVFTSDTPGRSLADPGVVARDAIPARLGPQPHKVTQETGSRLFNAVFAGEVYAFWRWSLRQAEQNGQGLRLRLFVRDPEPSEWPWEYLRDPEGRFLALSAKTPILRYLELPIPPRPLKGELPLRILVLTAEPSGCTHLDAEEEWKDLKKALKDLEKRGEVVLDRLERATLEGLHLKLRKPFHILHFIGHGTYARDQEHGTLLFQDGLVTDDQLATILRDQDSLRLVILNACEGAHGSRAERFSGVAQSLVHAGIPAVIAMQFRITDSAAIAFARSFYQEIARGLPVDAALAGARKTMYSRRHFVEWGTPVLFSRSPDGDLFGLPERPLPSRPWLRVAMLVTLLLVGAVIFNAALGGVDVPDEKTSSEPSPPKPPPPPNTKGCPPSELLGLEFVRIEPGVFVMESKRRLAGKKRVYEVEITRPYCISTTEVTQEQWKKVMDYNPSTHKGIERLPVENVSHDDALAFASALNRLEPGAGYNLPTEAQWQYGAQAGTGQPYGYGKDPDELPRYGNCLGRDEFDGTAPVKSFEPNRWGLYDMHGNVSEWVVDWFDNYPSGRFLDPKGPQTGERRVRRGGSWEVVAKSCTATKRNDSGPGYRSGDVGFRLVRTPEE